MSGDHNMYQKDKSYLDFECPRCGHCCKTDLAKVGEVGVWGDDEPVAWANSFDLQNFDMKVRTGPDLHHTVPLYTAPPKQWVGLTDDFVFELADTNLYEGGKNFGVLAFAKAIEQALKEKNT